MFLLRTKNCDLWAGANFLSFVFFCLRYMNQRSLVLVPIKTIAVSGDNSYAAFIKQRFYATR